MIAIIDYRAGNLTSVQRALNHLGWESVVTHDYSAVVGAERIIFPGVGAAGKAMHNLRESGLDRALVEAYQKGTPILGICLGTQIITDWSEENNTECLGLIRGRVRRFPARLSDRAGNSLKVPHMGWNGVELNRSHPLFDGLIPESEFYFVHAYYPEPEDPGEILGITRYGIPFASVLARRNLVAVQFHLEKSGRPGLGILSNFCKWDG
ncbi:MAG: imidazole glycerol phosphate synthase subunit HisH [Deltaproteobacteria bacterium]|nr:imidazole glycerol phosphate synthase subunit HisH [Deltaproteobacteria bacterium]MBW2137140.1 imidazole glycerol phosphate synthase subunit HisH [Deltaproteobacteria bacterium]